VREWAVAALEESDRPPPDAVSALTSLVAMENADVGYWAATQLGRIGADAARAVPALTQAVQHGASPAVCERAVWALGQIGPAAVSACSVLEAAVPSDSPRLERLVRQALERIRAAS
jgi:HEAT repeat protein